MSIEVGLAILGGIGGAYGALQSWLTQRKMRQVEVERLTTRLDIAFDHSIITTSDYKLLHGIVSFENKGETNLKIIRLNIDGRDRSSEFTMSYIPASSESQFVPLPGQLTSVDIVALNNYKQVSFSNSPEKTEFRIAQPDEIYAREKEPKLREVEDIKGNITKYVTEKIAQIRSVLEKKETSNVDQELRELLFLEIINKELRGLQLFPNAILNQEFLVKYQGTGVLYLNVETSTIRVLHEAINYVEQYKMLADRIFRTKELDNEVAGQLAATIRNILTPEGLEIHKQKESFLVHLS